MRLAGGDVLILEEAAYCDPGFFYETVAPILTVGRTSLLCISTLLSEINFYTRLIKMRDAATDLPIFTTFSIELVCQSCKDAGNFTGCKHLLWMVPSWQSSEKHVRLKQIMQDRPDLIRRCATTPLNRSVLYNKTCQLMTSFPQRTGWTELRRPSAGIPEVRHRRYV